MFVLFIALLAPIFYTFANIIECKLSNNIFKHPVVMVFYISLMNCLFLPLLPLYEQTGPENIANTDIKE